MTTYLLAGGGTAGHVNPMLAIAAALLVREPDASILMLGTNEGLEARLVPEAGFELLTIPKVPFPRRLNKAALTFIPRWRRAVTDVRHIIHDRSVDVVIGVGGYASAPAYAAARAAGVTIVIHEANARPGLANRLGARWTRFVGVAIAGTPLRHARLVGMPLRAEFESPVTEAQRQDARLSFGLNSTRPTVVVTGGSLGARRINEATRDAAKPATDAGVQILHLTGSATTIAGSPGYITLNYSDRMRDALACADLIVSRAGASTVCEIAALGLPAVFVPYPVGNGEQRFNALPLVDASAAILVPDAQFTSEFFRDTVIPLALNRARLQQMARAASALGIRDGAERMCALIDDARAVAKGSASLG